MADIGNAIALGNLATPINSRPLTRFGEKKLQLDLAERQAAAKAKADEAKLQQEISKMFKHGKGGYDPLFQGRANDIASKSYARQMQFAKAGDTLALDAEGAQMEAAQADLMAENKAFRETVDDLERNGLISKEAARIRNMTGQQAKDFYTKAVQTNPELKTVLNYDPDNDRFVANYVKGIDVQKDYQDLARSLEGSREELIKTDKYKDTETRYFGPKAETVLNQARARVQDPDYRSNVIIKNAGDYNKIYSELAKQVAASGQEVDPEALKMEAAALVVANNVKPLIKPTTDEWRARAPKSESNLNITFGSGVSDLNVNDGIPTNGKIPLKVKTTAGEVVRNVPTGNQYGYKMVEILNTKGEGFINADTNLPMKGQVFQSIKTGEATSVPIAVKGFTTAKGVTYKPGQMVDEKSIAGLTEDGVVEYRPMVKGTVTYNKDSKTYTVSVLAPAEQIGRAIISTQSKDDAPATAKGIQEAINEAMKLNTALKSRKKISTSKGKGAPKTLDLTTFDKTK